MQIVIHKIPLPPSVNGYLTPSGDQKRFVKSKKFRQYSIEVDQWALANHQIIKKLVQQLSTFADKPLRCDAYFVFHEPRLIAKDGKIKRLDVDNRLKPLRDQITKHFCVDDSMYFAGDCVKAVCKKKEEECVIVVIRPTQIMELNQILKLLELRLPTGIC